jgi:transcription antitermination factor NusG
MNFEVGDKVRIVAGPLLSRGEIATVVRVHHSQGPYNIVVAIDGAIDGEAEHLITHAEELAPITIPTFTSTEEADVWMERMANGPHAAD